MQSLSLVPKGLSMPAESNHVRVEHSIPAWHHSTYATIKERVAASGAWLPSAWPDIERVDAASLAMYTKAYPVLGRTTTEVEGAAPPTWNPKAFTPLGSHQWKRGATSLNYQILARIYVEEWV